ncbi:hypothetical protein ACFVT1_36315 [Streptomyces sp. NPDC057963]|uniref:hypothetical protein n=1 Tax=Streptomyces sp. NPDC057963 TaxID=3346290 RepID=UPI0036E24F04
MSSDVIQIQPNRAQRRPFAQWAVAQTPKLRTVGTNTFAVPAALFAEAPEDILIGALVDGHRYVSPDEDAALGRPGPGAGELLGVATPEGFTASAPAAAVEAALTEHQATPGDALQEVPATAYATETVPLDPPSSDRSYSTPGDEEHPDQEGPGPYPCPLCTRDFTTVRGRDSHRRQVHPEA